MPVKRIPPLATMVLTSSDASKDRKILRKDADRLWNEGKIDKIVGVKNSEVVFMMPLTLGQVLRNETPPFSKEVLDCIAKAELMLENFERSKRRERRRIKIGASS